MVPAIQNFEQQLTLTCDVTTVRGITSGLTIIWSEFGVEVRRVQNAIGNVVGTSVSYTEQSLTHDSNFSCRAIINSASRPQDVTSIRIELTCKSHIHSNCSTYVTQEF